MSAVVGAVARSPVSIATLSAVVLTAGVLDTGVSSASTTTTSTTLVTAKGGSIDLGIDQAPNTCNPNVPTHTNIASQLVLGAVLPSPFVVNPNGIVTPNSMVITQAEVVSLQPQTVVYTINPKAVWSDHAPITAADFIYAWEQQRGDPLGPTPTVDTLGYRDISSVVGSDGGRTVTVVFKAPFADWQMLFGDLLPAGVMQKVGWDPACTTVDPAIDLSGGPFALSSVTPGQITLVRNPLWWGMVPNLDRIVVHVVPGGAGSSGGVGGSGGAAGPAGGAAGSGAGLAAFAWSGPGKARAVFPSSFGPSFLASVSADPTVSSEIDSSSTFLQLQFDTIAPAVDSAMVRQAIARSIDRQALVNAVAGPDDINIVPSASHLYAQGRTGYPTATNPIVPINQVPNPPVPPVTTPWPLGADADETVKLLTQAGYTLSPTHTWLQPDGMPYGLRLVVDTGDAWAAQTGLLLAAQLQKAGFVVSTLSAPDARTAGLELAAGQADLGLIPTASSPYPTQAIAWFSTSLGAPGENGSQDWSNFDDPTLNSLLVQAASELNPVTAQPIYVRADALLWSSMVALPLFAEPTVFAWSARTVGVAPNPQGAGANLLWAPANWGLLVPARSSSS